jgi:4-amino-4-deoxy-L-arabinose transferase-like glycosyltransferase
MRHPDEAYYLTVVLEMEDTGDWVVPRIDGSPVFFKPPLMYWCALLARKVLGHTLFALRFPSALFAALTVGLTFLSGRELFRRQTALTAALLLASCLGLQRFGRTAMLETGLMLGTALALLGALKVCRSPYWIGLVGLGGAISTLLKWPGVAVVPLLTAFAVLCARRNLRALFTAGSLVGAAICLLLPLPWFWVNLDEPAFRAGFFSENIARLAEPRSTPTSLLGVFVYGSPWGALLLCALLSLRRSDLREPGLQIPLAGLAIVMAFWLLPAGAQYMQHVQAGLPAAFLLVARQLERESFTLRAGAWVTATVLFLAAAACLGVVCVSPDSATSTSAIGSALLLSASGALLLRRAAMPSAGLCAVAGALALGLLVPRLDTEFVPRKAAAALEGQNLVALGAYPGYYRIALGRGVRRAWGAADVTRHLERGDTVILDEEAVGASTVLPDDLVEVVRWDRTRSRLTFADLRAAIEARSLTPTRASLRAVRMGRAANPNDGAAAAP